MAPAAGHGGWPRRAAQADILSRARRRLDLHRRGGRSGDRDRPAARGCRRPAGFPARKRADRHVTRARVGTTRGPHRRTGVPAATGGRGVPGGRGHAGGLHGGRHRVPLADGQAVRGPGAAAAAAQRSRPGGRAGQRPGHDSVLGHRQPATARHRRAPARRRTAGLRLGSAHARRRVAGDQGRRSADLRHPQGARRAQPGGIRAHAARLGARDDRLGAGDRRRAGDHDARRERGAHPC